VDGFAPLSRRGQLGRLRRVGRAALARYGLEDARLTLQRYEQNATFRVDAQGGPYLLRMNRPGVHTADTIGSEVAWLSALRRDTGLGVPEPVAARNGSYVVIARDPGVPEPHVCVLLRWLDGRFVNDRLAPAHMRQVGALVGRLQEHVATWRPPAGFLRPRVDTLTNDARVGSFARSAALARRGDDPTAGDADRALQLVEALVSNDDAALFARALEAVWATTRTLATVTGAFGLIHGDLHHENFLFHRGEARAIDFDDCGWGFHLYDLAVTLSELENRPRYDQLRDALLEAYAHARPLPADHAIHLSALVVLRRMQILLWILESRDHAAFRDRWRSWARDELDAIATAVRSAQGVRERHPQSQREHRRRSRPRRRDPTRQEQARSRDPPARRAPEGRARRARTPVQAKAGSKGPVQKAGTIVSP
jgi:Ser/Thr protein kinase RdoA (MazF antagonist)